MNPALFSLIRLQTRGFLRRMTRGTRSPRRAIFMIIGLVVIALWIGPILVTAIAVRHTHPEKLAVSPQRFRAVAPLALLGICILTIVSSAGDKAIAFTPGEVDMLFPGPFTRRELLGYKLLKSLLGALLSGLLLSIALFTYSQSWIACYIGVVLTLLFIQLFSTAGVLLGQTAGKRAQSSVRKIVLVATIVLAFLAVRKWIASSGGMESIYQFRYSDLGRNLLAPFDPFGRAITAFDAVELGKSAGEALLIDLGLLTIVVMLDANYLEAATAASRRRHAQIQRIRGGSLLSSGVKGTVTWRLPRPPWLGGAGPIAWRQATSAARSAKGLLLLLLIIAMVVGPLLGTAAHGEDLSRNLVFVMAWLTVLLSGLLKFDFRGDLDHIDQLKAMPLSPRSLAVGQLIVPTLILTAAHVLLLVGLAATTHGHFDILIVAACLALPFNALLMAAENAIFLLFPTRPAAASPGDFQVLGRQAAQLIMKAAAVMIGLGIALGIAAPVYIFTGGSLVLLTMIASLVLLGETCALVPAIAWAFNRFDPSVDTPA